MAYIDRSCINVTYTITDDDMVKLGFDGALDIAEKEMREQLALAVITSNKVVAVKAESNYGTVCTASVVLLTPKEYYELKAIESKYNKIRTTKK